MFNEILFNDHNQLGIELGGYVKGRAEGSLAIAPMIVIVWY
jgi:hypothetical protein